MKYEDMPHQMDILPHEESAEVRLILPSHDKKRVLLARYRATDDEWEPDVGNSRRQHPRPTYWSYKSVGQVIPITTESSVSETIIRIARQELGISIQDLQLISLFYDRRAKPERIGRLYYLVRDWKGEAPFPHDTETVGTRFEYGHKLDKETDALPLSMEHFWVQREFLGYYIHHPEVARATNAWQDWENKKAKRAVA